MAEQLVAFRVRDILKLAALRDVKVLSGRKGMDNVITGVTIIEAPDIAQFVGGGEVLLTRMYAFQNCTTQEYQQYMLQLSQKRVSALVIKKDEGVNIAQDRIDLLIQLSEDYAIPLLEIPFEVPYRNITYPIMEHLFNEEVTKLKYFKATYDNFAAISLLPLMENGFGKILDALEKLIGNPVALFDKNLFCMVSTNDRIRQLKITADMNRQQTLYSKYTYLIQTVKLEDSDEEYNQYLVPVNVMFNRTMYLAITAVDRPIDALDFIAIENAVSALLLEFSKQRTVSEIEKRFKSDIIENILHGKMRSKQKLHQNANLIGLPVNGHYRVMVLSVSDPQDAQPSYNRQVECNNILYGAMIMHVDHVKIHDQTSSIAVVQEVRPQQKVGDYIDEMDKALAQIQQTVTQRDGSLVLTAGVGNVVEGLERIPQSFREATDALNLSELVDSREEDGRAHRMVLYSELGIVRMLLQFGDTERLREFIPESLQKLCTYKKAQRNDLINTLRLYLNNNQNVAKTAQDLYVHYKTVNYRIERIAEITGIHFDSPNDVLSVQIGLVILRILSQNDNNVL